MVDGALCPRCGRSRLHHGRDDRLHHRRERSPGDDNRGGKAPATTGGGEGEGSGDVFVHAADDEATTLDPAQVEPGEGGETIITQVYERLIEVGPDGPEWSPAWPPRSRRWRTD